MKRNKQIQVLLYSHKRDRKTLMWYLNKVQTLKIRFLIILQNMMMLHPVVDAKNCFITINIANIINSEKNINKFNEEFT